MVIVISTMVEIGEEVIIEAGVVLGAEGFGLAKLLKGHGSDFSSWRGAIIQSG